MIHPKLKSYSMKAEDGAVARRAKSVRVLQERKRRPGAAAHILKLTCAVPVFLLIGAALGRAQNLSIDWWTIDGGGGTARRRVCGHRDDWPTRRRPDDDRRSFALTGGFWALAVQTPGAPYLRGLHDHQHAALFWPSLSRVGCCSKTPTAWPV